MLTGCAQLTNLNDKESDELAEYMAGTVLRYTKNYDEALIYPAKNDETTLPSNNTDITNINSASNEENTSNNSQTTTTTPSTDSKNSSVSMEELFENVGNNKYTVSYVGYENFTSYPNDNEYFIIEPAQGNKLMVFSFSIKNNNKDSINVNLVNKKIHYSLNNAEGKSYRPAVSLLANDIQYLKDNIKGNHTIKAVLVFEVSKNIKVDDLSLVIKYSGKSSVISIHE